MNPHATALTTADDLVDFYIEYREEAEPFLREHFEAAIPAAIDALYTNRDAGGNMHSAAAAAGVAAIRAVSELYPQVGGWCVELVTENASWLEGPMLSEASAHAHMARRRLKDAVMSVRRLESA